MRFISFLSMLLLSVAAVAQTENKIPVRLSSSGEGTLGNRYAFELREAIRASQGMRLAEPPGAHIAVFLITAEEERSANFVAASITVAYEGPMTPLRGYLMTSSVELCGGNRLQDCARDNLASIDGAIETLKRDNPALWATLK